MLVTEIVPFNTNEMAKLLIFLIFGLIPCTLTKCILKEARSEFSRSINQFSNEIITKIAAEQENHFVVSIPSIWTSLASISLGATGATLEELNQVLRWKNKKCFHKRNLNISTTDASKNSTVVIERASNIYVDSKLTILKNFENKILKSGLSKFENISFEDVDSAAQTINDFVKRATHENIDQIVSPRDLANALLIMVDVIYFKGAWQNMFPKENTKINPFYDENGDKIGEVNLMSLTGNFKMLYIADLNAHVLELPYGNNSQYSMLLFRPVLGGSLEYVMVNFKNTSLFKIDEMLKSTLEDEVIVQIPRFEMASDLRTLKALLVSMGLKSPFDSSKATFKSMTHQELYISDIIQKANIKVTEEGTVASAATEMEISFRSSPSEFIANSPFLFMIFDKKSKIPIFTGAYSKPSPF